MSKSKNAARPSRTQQPVTANVPADIGWEAIFSALPHPIILVNTKNEIQYANTAAETFLSASLSMLRRMKLEDVLAFGCPLLALVSQVRETGATVNEYAIEMAAPRFAGIKLVDVYAGPIPESKESIVIMLQQRSMAQMIERQLTHRAAARSVSGLAAVLAHEIKNPLSGIRGAAQLLEPNASDDDRELTQLICRETDRIRNLVDRMEVFGDERPLATEPVNIHDVLDHVCRLAASGFGANIRIMQDYDPSLPAVRGNRDKLVQVFLNLIKNACEAIGPNTEKGQITLLTGFRPGVRLSVPGSVTRISLPLMIEVTDNGPGVADSVKSHLFDPFVTTKVSGSGLGLALVAKTIGDHGGIIECDSEKGRTTFRILLPMENTSSLRDPAARKSSKTERASALSNKELN